jgi:hypothetical protein
VKLPSPFSRFGKRERAIRANERGRELARQRRDADALVEYERAARIDPSWSVPFYNMGLVHKYAGAWELSWQENRLAVARDAADVAAWWNLGIAATALEEWNEARRAWRGAGMDVPDGEGPVQFPCGRTPVRLNPHGAAEVVWCDRLDPARAEIRSIPLPESGFRFRDVVLNDGAANGYRRHRGHELPVFDCLARLQASPFLTWVAQLHLPSTETAPAALDALVDAASEQDMAAEDWTGSLRTLCKACSEGRPHEEHEPPPPAEADGPRRVAIAARDEPQARALLDAWLPQSGGAVVLAFEIG